MPVSNPIRRALEAALKPVADAIPIPVQWGNITFDTKGVATYVRCNVKTPVTGAMTLGQSPRIQQSGYVMLGLFVPGNQGEDYADSLIGIQGTAADSTSGSGLLKAYPYSANLIVDGITVQVGVAKSGGDGANVDGWWYQPTQILWTCWRST
jgi:hypothetical protein